MIAAPGTRRRRVITRPCIPGVVPPQAPADPGLPFPVPGAGGGDDRGKSESHHFRGGR